MTVLGLVIAPGEQPLRINGEGSDDSCNDVDEEGYIDRYMTLIDEYVQPVRFYCKMGREISERAVRHALDNSAQALANGNDDRIVDGERQRFSAGRVGR